MPLLLLFLIILSFYSQNFMLIFWLAFLLGLISDLFNGTWLGLTSSLFLIVSFFIFLYRRRFASNHLLFQLSFIALTEIILVFINKLTWNWVNFIKLMGVSFVILILAQKILNKSASGLKI